MLCSFGKKRGPFIHLTVLLPFSLQTGNRWCLRHSETCPSLHPAGYKRHREQRRWRRPTGRRRFWWRWRYQHYRKYVTVLVHNIITTCLWKVQCQRLIVLFGMGAYARTDPANRILHDMRKTKQIQQLVKKNLLLGLYYIWRFSLRAVFVHANGSRTVLKTFPFGDDTF